LAKLRSLHIPTRDIHSASPPAKSANPTETKTTETKTTETDNVEAKASQIKGSETKLSENKPNENKPSDDKPKEPKISENQTNEIVGNEKKKRGKKRRRIKTENLVDLELEDGEIEALPTEILTRIISASNYFDMLHLPKPRRDALGLFDWPVSNTMISKHYRLMCLRCHPDKNPTQTGEANKAFECITKAYQCLSQEETRYEYAKNYLNNESKNVTVSWSPELSVSRTCQQTVANVQNTNDATDKHVLEFKQQVLQKIQSRVQAKVEKINKEKEKLKQLEKLQRQLDHDSDDDDDNNRFSQNRNDDDETDEKAREASLLLQSKAKLKKHKKTLFF